MHKNKQQIERVFKLSRVKWGIVVVNVFLFIGVVISVTGGLLLPVARAADSNFSKSFSTQNVVVDGSLVSLVSGSDDAIVLANSLSGNYLIGVATKADNSLLAVDPSNTKVQVVLSGQAMTIVSDIEGEIKTGDLIAQSPIDGVGQKAITGDRVLGIAKGDFSAESVGATKQLITKLDGNQKEVSIGRIMVLVSIGALSDSSSNDKSTAVEKWAASLFGKPVSLTRLILCGIIAVIALASLCVIIYGSIKSSIAAVGRNPLAKPTIFESLAQVMSMVALVSVIAVASMYFVVRI